jgi:hypothetical protein
MESNLAGVGRKMRMTIRMELFLTLLRLRKGYTYREMYSLFGWHHTSICTMCEKLEGLLRAALASEYQWPTDEQQMIMCDAFRRKLGFKKKDDEQRYLINFMYV